MAKRKRTKITQYTRNRNRIQAYIRKLKKAGLNVDIYFPTEKELRKSGVKGKELTKLTLELKKLTAKELRKIAEPLNKQEPTNTYGFKPPYNLSEDESFFDNVVISEWYATLSQFSNGEAYDLLRAWMGNTVRTNGKHNTAIMLQNGAENGHILTWEVVYKNDNAILYIGYMLDYLPDEGILYKEEVLDKIEYMKRLGDALEQDEDWEYPL